MESGFLINPHFLNIDASPDGISTNYVVEIKCPLKTKTVQNYMSADGKLKTKLKEQVQL